MALHLGAGSRQRSHHLPRILPLIQTRISSRHLAYARSHNGRFLRHRPERSGRCLKYKKVYQGQRWLPKSEGVPEGP
ncbi:MAG TPA: hypothetical protein DDW52_10380 [Planctomycetaceae bacterium]|nr:hypothetical protein [Planctomycetaceae bacterium]